VLGASIETGDHHAGDGDDQEAGSDAVGLCHPTDDRCPCLWRRAFQAPAGAADDIALDGACDDGSGNAGEHNLFVGVELRAELEIPKQQPGYYRQACRAHLKGKQLDRFG